MSEPTPDVLHVEPVYEPWDVAVDAVCSALETYAAYRLLSGDIPGCARTTGITDATAARFERSLDAISDGAEDDPEDSATPGRSGPEVADTSE